MGSKSHLNLAGQNLLKSLINEKQKREKPSNSKEVGKTVSGKSVYEDGSELEQDEDFTSQDHLDASSFHVGKYRQSHSDKAKEKRMTSDEEGKSSSTFKIGDSVYLDGKQVKITRVSDDNRIYVKEGNKPEVWVKPSDLSKGSYVHQNDSSKIISVGDDEDEDRYDDDSQSKQYYGRTIS